MDKKAVAIGIDLGTTYSCVAVWQNDQVEIIPNDQGNRTMPSCVSFTEEGGRLIGEGAKNKIISNATNTIYDAKRLIGRRFTDTKVEEDMKSWPFKVIRGTNDIPHIVVEDKGKTKEITAEEISSMILGKLKKFAEDFLDTTVIDAVITVPAYFDDSQRQATKDAGLVAGLNVLQILNEPTSAAIAYGLDMKTDITRGKNVLVFDLGGGTFDVSLVTIDENCKIKVKAVTGDTHLGGQDFDKVMVDHFVEQFNKKHETDMSKNKKALGRLRIECEKAKRVLSLDNQTDIEIDCLHDGIDFSMRITRAKFESLNRDFFSKCIELVESCLGDAQMNKEDVDEVVLVGGSTRIPKVQELLKAFFNGKELCKRIHPDEAVAYGAAVLAAKLGGSYSQKVKHLELVDVVPLSLGLKLCDDSLSVLIKRNTPIPASEQQVYSNFMDYQKAIRIDVYQGERSMAIQNNWLGTFDIRVPPAPKGMSVVKVVFEIDANGILNCSGEEVTTGLTKHIRITPDKQRLSNADIKKMLLEAQKYKLEDEEFKEKIFARNALDDYINKVNSKIEGIRSTNKQSISKKDVKKIEKAIDDADEVLNGSKLADVNEYEKALGELENICFPIIAQPNTKQSWWRELL